MKHKLWLVLALMLVFALPVTAQSESDLYAGQWQDSGAAALTGRLPADTRELLERLRVDPGTVRPTEQTDLNTVLSVLLELTLSAGADPLRVTAALLGVVLLSSLGNGVGAIGDGSEKAFRAVTVLSGSGVLLTPLTALMGRLRETVDSVTVFLSGFVPVYGGILAVGGAAARAVAYETTLLAAGEILVQFIRTLVFPLLCVSLAWGCVGAVTEGFRLDSFSRTIHKGVLWALGLLTTVFSGVLSLQQMVAAAGDGTGTRVVKFSLASFVPAVGGALSEAYATVLGCTGLLRSTVGSFGLIVTVVMILPPMLSCILWSLCLHLCAGVAGLFELTPLERLCQTVAGTARVMVAVLAVFALLMIVSTTVLVFVGKGAVPGG